MSQSDMRHRRIQFSSCDGCRKARVACDATRSNRESEPPHALSSCTRCLNRDRQCTFEWMKSNSVNSRAAVRERVRRQQSVSQDDTSVQISTTLSPLPHTHDFGTSEPHSPKHGTRSTSSKLVQASPTTLCLVVGDRTINIDRSSLRDIYEQGFETIFGSWMGKYSNPFVFGEQSDLEPYVSISRLCRQLDKWMEEENSDTPTPNYGSSVVIENDERSLEYAIEAFAARWLHLTPHATSAEFLHSEVIKSLWRRARRDMLKVINRTSYRSMLALLLFGLTPIPTGIADEEELDGVSGQVCVHAALQQIQTLRARQRSLQFNGTQVNITLPRRTSSVSPQSFSAINFINAESTAYWAALTFDTSASLTLSCRPLLSSGLFGIESESSWRMVRTCMEVFRGTTKEWSVTNTDMTDEQANQVIAAGAAWKLLLWKLTANFKESLRDGHDEFEVRRAFESVSEAINKFDATYRDLLTACYNRILFYSQETRLRWYELTLHYHLCILMMVDNAEATDRQDLLSEFQPKRTVAESWVLNCLVFGLNNKYALRQHGSLVTTDKESGGSELAGSKVSLIAIDPYPHHVVAAVKLMQQSLERDFASGKIGTETYHDLISVLTKTLDQLPQGSKSVQIAKSSVSL